MIQTKTFAQDDYCYACDNEYGDETYINNDPRWFMEYYSDEDGIWIGGHATSDEERQELENANNAWKSGSYQPSQHNERQINNRLNLFSESNQQKKCVIDGTMISIVESMNALDQMINDRVYSQVDIKDCNFEMMDDTTGLYSCPVNASTGMWIITDINMKPQSIQIFGPADNGKPSKAAYDWAFVATTYACTDLELEKINDIFLQTWKTGYYADSNIEMACGDDPYLDDFWVYFIANK